jgi:uncharacterized protein (UPF0332 family)
MFAQQILETARAFLQLGMNTQVIRRIIIGRLYYAAHHLGRRLLREVGLAPNRWRVGVHQRVLNELERHYVNTGLMSRDALDALFYLRRLRNWADYDLNRPIRTQNVNQALTSFILFFDVCRTILEA